MNKFEFIYFEDEADIIINCNNTFLFSFLFNQLDLIKSNVNLRKIDLTLNLMKESLLLFLYSFPPQLSELTLNQILGAYEVGILSDVLKNKFLSLKSLDICIIDNVCDQLLTYGSLKKLVLRISGMNFRLDFLHPILKKSNLLHLVIHSEIIHKNNIVINVLDNNPLLRIDARSFVIKKYQRQHLIFALITCKYKKSIGNISKIPMEIFWYLFEFLVFKINKLL